MYETSVGMSKISMLVRESCSVSPFSRCWIRRSRRVELVARHEARADRAERVEALAAEPLAVAELVVAGD